MLCNQHHYLVPECFHHPRRKVCPPQAIAPRLTPLRALENFNLLSASVESPILNISYRRNHLICGLWVWRLWLGIMFSRLAHFVACIGTAHVILSLVFSKLYMQNTQLRKMSLSTYNLPSIGMHDLTQSLSDKQYYYLHFIDEEAKIQKGWIPCPQSPSD